MIILAPTTDSLYVITSAAGDVEVHTSWVDNNAGTITPGRTNTASITTATTTTFLSAPAASTYRAVKYISVINHHATVSNQVEVYHTDGTNPCELIIATLAPGETLTFTDGLGWQSYTKSGVVRDAGYIGALYNQSTTSQGAGFATDTYVTGSNILIPSQRPRVGTRFRCEIGLSKTAASTAAAAIYLRYGTAASTADTALCTFTLSAQTAATDQAVFIVRGIYRTVGSGTSAVVQGAFSSISQPTTGFSSLLKSIVATSSGHDSTTANTYLGVSMNGGASASWTVQYVESTLENI